MGSICTVRHRVIGHIWAHVSSIFSQSFNRRLVDKKQPSRRKAQCPHVSRSISNTFSNGIAPRFEQLCHLISALPHPLSFPPSLSFLFFFSHGFILFLPTHTTFPNLLHLTSPLSSPIFLSSLSLVLALSFLISSSFHPTPAYSSPFSYTSSPNITSSLSIFLSLVSLSPHIFILKLVNILRIYYFPYFLF